METQLNMAAELLLKPDAFHVSEQSLAAYHESSREEELTAAMLELEQAAKDNGAKSGFW